MASRAVPVLSQDAQYILCVPVLLSRPHPMHVCHTLRRTIVARYTSKREVALKSVLRVSIAHLSRPILEAVPFVCLCVCVFVCLCVCLVVWLFGCLVVWLFGCLVVWLFGCLVVWLFGCLVVWLFGCLVVWLFGCLVVWLFGCLVVWLLLVVVGCCWLLLVVVGCCWLLLVVVGCCWLLLVVVGCCCSEDAMSVCMSTSPQYMNWQTRWSPRALTAVSTRKLEKLALNSWITGGARKMTQNASKKPIIAATVRSSTCLCCELECPPYPRWAESRARPLSRMITGTSTTVDELHRVIDHKHCCCTQRVSNNLSKRKRAATVGSRPSPTTSHESAGHAQQGHLI